MCQVTRQYYYLIYSVIFGNFLYGQSLGNLYISVPNQIANNNNNNISSSSGYVPIFLNDNISYSSKNATLISANVTSHKRNQNNNINNPRTIVPLSSSTTKTDLNSNNNEQAASGYNNVLVLVKNLDNRLKNIRNIELGVTIIQEIFDAMDFIKIIRNDSETVSKFASRLTKKLNKTIITINQLRNFFLKNLTNINEPNIFVNTLIQPCPFEDFTLEQNYNVKKIQILNYLKNNGYKNHDDLNFTINANLVDELRRHNDDTNHFKHIYFLSRNDHSSDHNCQYYFNDIHFRYLYISAIKRKHIFLLVDHGNAFNSEQLELSKIFVTNILNMLSETDYISLITISNIAESMLLKRYYTTSKPFMYPATMDIKEDIFEFMANLNRSQYPTNHTLGFEYAFKHLLEQNLTSDMPIKFLYITRGLLSHLTEGLSVLTSISYGQSLLKFPIIIDTCAVVLDERRIMYEKQFLRDISQQNYTKYGIDTSSWYKPKSYKLKGNFYVVTKRHLERIIKTSCAIFEDLFTEKYVSSDFDFHLPVIDYNMRDVIVSITRSVKSFGIVGVNMYLTDLAEDVIYFKQTQDSYAFLIDVNGVTISHPAFQRPIATIKNQFPVDIGYLENYSDFHLIRHRILTENSGNATISARNNNSITYTWKSVYNAYIICIATKIKGMGKFSVQLSRVPQSFQNVQNTDYLPNIDLLYHRIDLIPPQTPVCRHFRQIATLDSGTVFLSASSFQSPFIYMKNNRDNREDLRTHNAQSIMAYIKDVTNLLANPGLLPQIRNDVTALYHVISYLQKRHQENGVLKKYIIRRYAATVNGVIQVYPGSILGTDLEPSRRPWFRKAMKHSGKIIVTEPYLDAGGAGYIMTIAHTIFEGKANALHNAERDVPVAIVAIDVPYAFFYKLVLEASPLCSEANIKCLLIEDDGYLVAHPSIMEPAIGNKNNRRPLEHITHKESFVANDILNHKQLVQKKACANYQNRTIQRYYVFNTSLTEVLTNVIHGERTKYQITTIKGTNLFAAVLNSTCDGGAFCPCSTVDRICLNCNRMDQTDCECPCECPLHLTDNDNPHFDNKTDEIAYCEPASESFFVINSLSYDWNMIIKSCISTNCDVYTTQIDCLGIMGCEWCQWDLDGNPFPIPFCASQSSCGNGVLGSMTPYGDNDLGSAVVEPSVPPAYSAIGPVGGAIIALCLVVGFAMYCYKQNLDNSTENFYADSLPEDNYGVPLSRFNFEDISPHDDSDLSGNGPTHRNLLQSVGNPIAVPDISPYHMSSSGYRRPNGESDHGYSTMTPHEDSEHMCFTLVEPLINNKRLSMSDSVSINTSVSSPTNQNQLIPIDRPSLIVGNGGKTTMINPKDTQIYGNGQTVLPEQISPHHILAPVTVHRHMEAL